MIMQMILIQTMMYITQTQIKDITIQQQIITGIATIMITHPVMEEEREKIMMKVIQAHQAIYIMMKNQMII